MGEAPGMMFAYHRVLLHPEIWSQRSTSQVSDRNPMAITYITISSKLNGDGGFQQCDNTASLELCWGEARVDRSDIGALVKNSRYILRDYH